MTVSILCSAELHAAYIEDLGTLVVPQSLQIVPMDAFAALFGHFAPQASAFFAGNLCTVVNFEDARSRGHLHVLRGGFLRMTRPGAEPIEVSTPSLILSPRHLVHGFSPDPVRGADLTCATIEFGGGQGDPIATALPELLIVPLDRAPTFGPTLSLLFDEAFAQRGGRQIALDRLFEYLLIQIIRHATENGRVDAGALAALADPKLAKAVNAMHEAPSRDWSLESLADEAGMSRTRFAEHFRVIVGTTPMDYLQRWRIAVAQGLLRKGRSMKAIAAAVGYDSPAALTRAFAKIVGAAPTDWLEAVHAADG